MRALSYAGSDATRKKFLYILKAGLWATCGRTQLAALGGPAWHRPLLLLGNATYPYLAATRADLLRRFGRTHDAAQAYRTALTLASNAAEKDLLTRRLAEVTAT